MTRRAVILDIDGTLVDSNDAHAHAWVEAFADEGITVRFDRVRRAIGMGGDKLLPSVARLDAESAQGKRISERRGEIFRKRYLPELRAFPRVRELAERLRADAFVLVVGSSAKADELKPLLERAGIADLVTGATSSDDAEESKPAPDIVHAALDTARSTPRTTIMLGDTPYDLEAASHADVGFVGLESGGWRAGDLAGALAVYADAADLLARYDESPFARMALAVQAPSRS